MLRSFASFPAVLVLAASLSAATADIPVEKPDPAAVKARIDGLAQPSSHLPAAEQPVNWLRAHRQYIVPDLIEALQRPDPHIVAGCLRVLEGAPESTELVSTLIPLADSGQPGYRFAAMSLLADYVSNGKAHEFLEGHLAELLIDAPAEKWAKISDAFRNQVADGRRLDDQVGELLSKRKGVDYVTVLNRLADLGVKESVARFEKAAADTQWPVARAGHLAMARLGLGHPLTGTQVQFVKEADFAEGPRAGGASKGRVNLELRPRSSLEIIEAPEVVSEPITRLAALDKAEVRPFMLQMLRTDNAVMALRILIVSRDKELLPEVDKLRKSETRDAFLRGLGWRTRMDELPYLAEMAHFVISVEEGELGDILEKLRLSDGNTANVRQRITELMRSAAFSDIPTNEKVEILTAFRHTLKADETSLVPALFYYGGQRHDEYEAFYLGRDLWQVVMQLMADENELDILGRYAAIAQWDRKKHFAGAIRDALAKVSAHVAGAGADSAGIGDVLRAALAYRLEEAGPVARDILKTPPGRMSRLAAAETLLDMGQSRREAIGALCDLLDNSDDFVRSRAIGRLILTPCIDETERAEREDRMLSLLGTPSESAALPVLAKCGGAKTVEKLLPLLDGENVERAVYAAWLLTTMPDKSQAEKGLRRIAIFVGVAHGIWTKDPGKESVDVRLPGGARFFWGRWNPPYRKNYLSRNPGAPVSREFIDERNRRPESTIAMPAALQKPFEMDKDERAFAERLASPHR